MKSHSFDEATARKIKAAHNLSNRPFWQPLSKFTTIRELIEHHAKEHADDPFLIYRDGDERRTWTYGDFIKKVSRIANLMRYKLGVEPNDRVCVVAYNHDETVALAFACWAIGAVYVPINITEPDERIAFVTENAECKVVFVMPDLIERYNAIKPTLKNVEHFVQICGAPEEAYKHLPTLVEGQTDSLETLGWVQSDTEALIVYTSGTTGQPKGVVLEHYNVLADAHAICEWFDFGPHTRAMMILPMHHVNGLILTLLSVFYAGGSTVLNRKFSASRYWAIVEEEACTFGSTVPTILSFLNEAHEDIKNRHLGGFYIICGAGPLTVELAKRFLESFGVRVVHGYGLSETAVYSCYLPTDLTDEEYRHWMVDYGFPAIGVPIACNEMAIQDSRGRMVKEGERGEIVIRGHNVMQCYFKRPEANAEAFEFGWFRSGDEGFYMNDAQGRPFFFITGRLKELIIRGGINYSPLEIDECLSRIPGVKVGMAVGFENNMYGEEIGAYVVKEEGAMLNAEQVLQALADLPFAKRPKVVVFGEEVPITATGKYQRNKLKPLFEAYKDTQFREDADAKDQKVAL